MIQINMKMPENCWQCPIMDGQDGYCRITNEDAPIDGKLESCPLQEDVRVRCIDCRCKQQQFTGQAVPKFICTSSIWKELGKSPHIIDHDMYKPIRCDHFEKKEENDGTDN